MSLTLVDNYAASKFAVFELPSGKGVIALTNDRGSKNNAAVFPDVATAQDTALAVAWGRSLNLTHRIKPGVITEAVSNGLPN